MQVNLNKIIFGTSLLLTGLFSNAQTPIRSQAIIQTKINVVAPEEDEMQQMQGNGDGGPRFNFRNMMDGETESVTYIKGDLMKTSLKSESIKMAIYRNQTEKSTTTVVEMMGNVQGYRLTDQEQADMQRMRDSMMAERRKRDSSRTGSMERERKAPTVLFERSNEKRKIAGFECIKGYLITLRFLGQRDTTEIWYTPDVKFDQLRFTGGFSGMPMMGGRDMGLAGTDQVDGFIMQYNMKLPRKRTMSVEVTKLDFNKEISAKELTVPANVEIKPFREMQQMFGGGRGGGRQRFD
jgi:hypothetical protein